MTRSAAAAPRRSGRAAPAVRPKAARRAAAVVLITGFRAAGGGWYGNSAVTSPVMRRSIGDVLTGTRQLLTKRRAVDFGRCETALCRTA
ncbi:hypothetical protein CLV72_102410 [Allonocardiopsis opalescens]|uniref:Uncharacterized protein n=1 Tax=Allonocardiopsis opalescens TaxID=1144618 RepID=A0A2T0QA67_9ACTN|nr:hypothetical protein CLV72_102410 [Allonocardiopsis opalescens]